MYSFGSFKVFKQESQDDKQTNKKYVKKERRNLFLSLNFLLKLVETSKFAFYRY